MTNHRLPEDLTPADARGCADWFTRYTPFIQAETRRQIAYKRRMWPDVPDGAHAKYTNHTYPHILPDSDWRLNLFAPIAAQAEAYLRAENIEIHSEKANLRSSQFACLNVLFPLRLNLDAARAFLAPCLPGVRRVLSVEFEVTGNDDALAFMGDPPGGKRGANRTSIDAVVEWLNDTHDTPQTKPHCTFIEWKYTEEGFGSCGGYASKGNPNPRVCETLDPLKNPVASCYLASGASSRVRRNYWKHTPPTWLTALAGATGCPFRGPLYQLWRQRLLADHFASTGRYSSVNLVAVHWSANASLADVPPALRGAAQPKETVGQLWNRATGGFTELPIEALLRAYDDAPTSQLSEWREYVRERYGV
ncbi:hypothetical protein LBMAG42_54890 [Deltaproteobacteria bacterium]|nr:hypothetical protein LBMAG42_54890 [Deltaproteobacteria bacterium]